MNILYIGTSDFAIEPLNAIVNNGYNIVGIITQKDKTGGRGKKLIKSPVKCFAEKKKIGILQPENINSESVKEFIKVNNVNLGIVVSYGQMIKQEIFSLPDLGMINIHPSLLPKYRGASPIQTCLLNGDIKTGVSVIRITDKMDAGCILLQKEVAVDINDNYFTLQNLLAQTGKELIIKFLKILESGNRVGETIQNEEEATYCKLIRKEDALINWNEPAVNIHNKIRAFAKWPVAFTYLKGKILKIYQSNYMNDAVTDKQPGTLIKLSKNKLLLVCGDNKMLEILKLQLQGKKILSAVDFLNGIKIETGDLLG